MGLDMWLTRASDGADIYWRKANQIRKWFADRGYAENSVEHEVPFEELEQLLIACERVKENHELASELLPTQSGFFFGGTEYNDWYFEDIQFTIDELSKFVNAPGAESDSYVYYEWW